MKLKTAELLLQCSFNQIEFLLLSYSPHHLGVLASKNSHINNYTMASPCFINVRISAKE